VRQPRLATEFWAISVRKSIRLLPLDATIAYFFFDRCGLRGSSLILCTEIGQNSVDETWLSAQCGARDIELVIGLICWCGERSELSVPGNMGSVERLQGQVKAFESDHIVRGANSSWRD